MIGHAEISHNLNILNLSSVASHCHAAVNKDLNISNSAVSNNNATTIAYNTFDLWHYMLGHPSHTVLHQLCTTFPYILSNKMWFWDSCHFAKQCRLPFPNSTTITLHAFDLLHMDIWGPLRVPSNQGHQHFLTIVDYYTRYTWLFLMKNKGDTFFFKQNKRYAKAS